GVIACYAKLHGRRGIHSAPFAGNVYFVDAITNNPGAAGGVITTRKGELLGLVGKELKNTLSETWINYAVPIQAKAEIRKGDQVRTVSIMEMLDKKADYRPVANRDNKEKGPWAYHGIVLVPNVSETTPPYVDDVLPGSPAARAGLKVDDLIVYVDGEQVVA